MSSLARSRSVGKPEAGDLGFKKTPELNQNPVANASPSRLPVKGAVPPSSTSSTSAGARTRATSTAVKSVDVSGSNTAKSRPISGMLGLGRSASVRQPAQSNSAAITSSTTSRPPITTRSRPIGRPASASETSPVSSRPTTSSGVPSSSTSRPPGAGHARTKSSATTLTGATTLRPPSQPSTSTSAAPSIATGRPTRSATLTSRLGHTRALSTSSTSTTSTINTTTTAAMPPRPPRKRITPQTEEATISDTQSKPQHKLLGKPAFSTLQQHYSPAKNLAPKPLTSTFLAPPSPSKLPMNVAISAETARLQTELLQLHLLHRDADAVCASWRESARQKLGDRFHAMAAAEKEIREEEGQVVERRNVAALKNWGGNELEEKIRLLDVVLTTVWSWNETGGKYARTVRRFERWAEQVAGVIEARGYHLPPGQEMVFISDLDASWREDCGGLVRKLNEWRDVLVHDLWVNGVMGEEEVSSSLERILGGLRALVEDMLSELALMRAIEREAIVQENEWVQGMNREREEAGNDTRAGAIWRVV